MTASTRAVVHSSRAEDAYQRGLQGRRKTRLQLCPKGWLNGYGWIVLDYVRVRRIPACPFLAGLGLFLGAAWVLAQIYALGTTNPAPRVGTITGAGLSLRRWGKTFARTVSKNVSKGVVKVLVRVAPE